ncbi:CPBP family glutamic-type intramembrane protease [Sphingomonas sp. RS6]
MIALSEPLIFVAAIALYYGVLARFADRAVLRLILRRHRAPGDANVSDMMAIVDISVAATFQLALVIGLSVLFAVPATTLLWRGWTVELFAITPALAVAELSAASMLASVALAALPKGKGGDWRAMMNAGWLRSFLRAGRGRWRIAAGAVLIVYIGAEEFLFRAVALDAFKGWGTPGAVVASTLLFLVAQCAGMPSVRHALFPLAGAAVMGPVHCALAIEGAPLSMLIIIHLLFFLAATTTGPSLAGATTRMEAA